MDGNNINEHVRILEEYCASDDISLDGLREKLNQITQPTALACSHFLHELCLNQNVTHDMVQLVLENNPYAAYCVSNRYSGISYTDEDVERYEAEQKEDEDNPSESPRKRKCSSDRTFPIHLAASNVHCPNSVVELLAKSNPSALGHLSKLRVGHNKEGIGSIESTPLHCYLSRTSNLQLDTVKMLVDMCQESLELSQPEELYFPIEAIIDNPEVGSYCEVVKYLVDTDPTILQNRGRCDQLPLHTACCRSNTTEDLVQILVDGYPMSAKVADCNMFFPIHHLCDNNGMKEKEKLGILRILIDAYPKSLRAQTRGMLMSFSLPIHIASYRQSPAFCKMLVDGYPDSLQKEDRDGYPFHLACELGSIETVKYLYEADQECINKRTGSGLYPLHMALRAQGDDQYEITKFLLQCDPSCAKLPIAIDSPVTFIVYGLYPLHLACSFWLTGGQASPETVQLLFDAYPAVLCVKAGRRGGSTPIEIANESNAADAADFLQRQVNDLLGIVRKPDLNFPLHQAVQNNVTLGVFRLLVENIPSKLPKFPQNEHGRDDTGKTTLHLACEYGNIGIVQYLIQRSNEDLSTPDSDGNYPLHLACREGHCDIVNSLLEASTVSVSTQNGDKKLPIELLIESDCDQDSLVYTEAVWRLLVASPPTNTGQL